MLKLSILYKKILFKYKINKYYCFLFYTLIRTFFYFFSNFCIICFSASSSWVLSVAFDPKEILVSGSEDRTIKLWNKNTGNLLRTLRGHGNWVWTVAFDSNDILASGSRDNTIKLWG